MKIRATALILSAAILCLPSPSAPAQDRGTRRSTITNPFITGSFTDATGGQGVFSGHLKLLPFEVQANHTVAVGKLTGTLSDSSGAPLGSVDQKITWTVESVEGTCQAVQLKFAGMDVNLPDTKMHVESIVLDIDKETQPDARIGDLLCSVAGLGKREASDQELTATLNDLFRALR